MDNSVSRRLFLGGTATAGLGFAFAGDGSLEAFARPEPRPPAPMTGYGPLVPDPNNLLALPAGFSYKIIAESGKTLDDEDDGDTVDPKVYASDPDGMAVFAGAGGGSVLVTNHEYGGLEAHRVKADLALTYDPGSFGGTTTIEVDANGNRQSLRVSLAGTENNCAGGITPWGTWLTCEETEHRAKVAFGAVTNPLRRVLTKNHGYVFEVHPTNRAANLNPVPLTFLGRFSHEAVAVDPRTYEIYLTEDAATPNGLYYRWQPPAGFTPAVGSLRALATEADGVNAGRLQAMSCYRRREHIVDLSQATEVGTRYRVRWVDVPDRTGGIRDVDPQGPAIRLQTFSSPITRSRKLEGQWWGNGGAYFVSSFARPLAAGDGSLNAHDGQVWFYNPQNETVTLKTIFGFNEVPRPTADQPVNYDGPDNITVSPHGGLILAEDGVGIQHLIGVSRQGVAYPLARNEMYRTTGDDSEFCGPTFSADGRTLFVNMYAPGYTFAITGPWRRDRH